MVTRLIELIIALAFVAFLIFSDRALDKSNERLDKKYKAENRKFSHVCQKYENLCKKSVKKFNRRKKRLAKIKPPKFYDPALSNKTNHEINILINKEFETRKRLIFSNLVYENQSYSDSLISKAKKLERLYNSI